MIGAGSTRGPHTHNCWPLVLKGSFFLLSLQWPLKRKLGAHFEEEMIVRIPLLITKCALKKASESERQCFLKKTIYYLFIHLFLACWVFLAGHMLSLVAASKGLLQLWDTGFSLWWLLLCVCVCVCVCVGSITQSYPTLCNLMDYSPPGSSVHGIFQARILEWVAISYFRGSFQSKIKPKALASPASAKRFFSRASALEHEVFASCSRQDQ